MFGLEGLRRWRRQRNLNCWRWWWDGDEEDNACDFDRESSDGSDGDDLHDDVLKRQSAVTVWFRLFCVLFLSMFVAGFTPGQALFIRMFGETGIYSSLCEEGQTTCVKSEVHLASAFSIVSGITTFSILPAGYLFDRFGARLISVVGASSAFIGVLLVEIPVLGVAYGYDELTSYLFPYALVITDVGNLLNSYCILGFIYHLPSSQMVVASLIVVQQQLCTLLPDVMQYVQQLLDLDMPTALGLLAATCLFAAISLSVCVPSRTEYLKQAKRVTGVSSPATSSGIVADTKRVCIVMRVRWKDHVVFGVALSSIILVFMAYSGLIGVYIELLWGSKKAGDDMATLLTLFLGTLGTLSAVIAGAWVDYAGPRGLNALNLMLLTLIMLATINVMGTAYVQQLLSVVGFAIVYCMTNALALKYCVAHVGPSQIGLFNGILWSGIFVLFTLGVSIFFQVAGSATTSAQLGFDLMFLMALACVCYCLWALWQCVIGFPERPANFEDDLEPALEEPFLG